MKKDIEKIVKKPCSDIPEPGFDPEMLFVECARCGSPVLWEKGRSTEILEGAGIDSLELDPYCLLVTDGCPKCSQGKRYSVQVFRVEAPHSSWGNYGRFGRA